MKDLVIWGAGGHARVVADIVALQGEYRTVAFLDDTAPGRAGEVFCGAEVLTGQSALDVLHDLPGNVAAWGVPARVVRHLDSQQQ